MNLPVQEDSDEYTELCKKLEFYETPEWAAQAILEKECLTHFVVDPCVGDGVLAHEAWKKQCDVWGFDIRDWNPKKQFGRFVEIADWLSNKIDALPIAFHEATCFMNPPFSLADKFVEKAAERGFRKIICFQRFAWYESAERRMFWEEYPPSRIWLCGSRATCWRHDIPINKNGKRYDRKTGKELSSATTVHAWFVWDRGAPLGTLLGRLYKKKHGSLE